MMTSYIIHAEIKNFAPPAARSVFRGLFGAKVRCRSKAEVGNALRAHPPYILALLLVRPVSQIQGVFRALRAASLLQKKNCFS
jgi:hypothetical protein